MLPVNNTLKRSFRSLTTLIALAIAGLVLVYAWRLPLGRVKHTNLILGLALTLYYFRQVTNVEAESYIHRIYQAIFTLLGATSLLVMTYIHVNYARWLQSGFISHTNLDLIVGGLLIFLIIHVTAMEYGYILSGVIAATIAYGLAGPYIPGIFGHSGLGISDLIVQNVMTFRGTHGFLSQIAATWIAIFIVFAGVIFNIGGDEFIQEVGEKLAKYSPRLVAQTSIISSAFMGSMMGSAASNVATTGSFTIPLMKERGIPSKFAGAYESVASSGGQILPPIMGTAAFLMADITGVPYADIIISATLPAILFYFTVMVGVQTQGTWYNWVRDEGEEDIDINKAGFLGRSLKYLLPLVSLIIMLVAFRWGPLQAGLYAIVLTTILHIVHQIKRGTPGNIPQDILSGLRRGGDELAPFMAVSAGLGVMIYVFSLTSLAQELTFQIQSLAGGQLWIVLLMAMFISLLFGLGMPTPAAYILIATLTAPAIIRVAPNMEVITAHLFVFYFALLSAITPPVAIAVVVATTVAGSDFIETAIESMKLGAGLFIVPFIFVLNPSILYWQFPTTILVLLSLMAAMVAIIQVLMGHNGHLKFSMAQRGFQALLAVGIIFAGNVFIKIALATLFVGYYYYLTKSSISLSSTPSQT